MYAIVNNMSTQGIDSAAPHRRDGTCPKTPNFPFQTKSITPLLPCASFPYLPLPRSFLRLRAAPCFVQNFRLYPGAIPRHNSPRVSPSATTTPNRANRTTRLYQPTTAIPSPSPHHNPRRKHPPTTPPPPQPWRATQKKRTRCSSASAPRKRPKQASSTSTGHDDPNSSQA